jgi:hypothetical protein
VKTLKKIDSVFDLPKNAKLVSVQYGNSKPATTEEEAFYNFFKDTFEVKKP